MKTPRTKARVWTTVALTLLSALVLGLAFPSSALAWDDCPFGEIDCAYPGDCSRYIDTNGDGTCDHSQPEPTASTTTVSPETSMNDSTTVTTEESSTGGNGRGNHGAGTALASAATADTSSTTSTTVAASALALQTVGTSDPSGASFLTHYYISPMALGFFLVYAVSFFLYKTKRIKVATHRKIWNVLLMVTFLVTGIFGLLLVIQLDYDLPFQIPFDLLFWHVEAGIVMTLISLFHLGWHFRYYANLVRTGRSKARAARTAERVATPRPVEPGQVALMPERVRSSD